MNIKKAWWLMSGGGGTEPEPTPITSESLLAEYAVYQGDITDISGVDDGRTPKNLFAINSGISTLEAYYPPGTGGDSINYPSTQAFTICIRIKSNSSSSENIIMSNQDWAGTYKGIEISHNSGGSLTASLYAGLYTSRISAALGAFQNNNGVIVTGDRDNINDGKWHFIAVTYSGSTASLDNLKLYVDKAISATNNNSSNTSDEDTTSPYAWYKLGGRPNAVEANNITFGEVIFYNTEKTLDQLMLIEDGYIDTVGLQRYYKNEEENGAVIYNHYVTNYATPSNGQIYVISGGVVNDLRVAATGSTGFPKRSFANKYGYTVSGSTVIPVNLYDPTKDVTNATPTYVGKVKYPPLVNSVSPLSFKPNPNGYAELNNLGLTSGVTITAGESTYFYNSEKKNPLFRNKTETRFLCFYRALRHMSDGQGSDEIGPALTHLSIKTYIITLDGQSNAVGSNNTGVDDFVNAAYRDLLPKMYVANNVVGYLEQNVTGVSPYEADVNGGGSDFGPDASLMGDLNTANKTIYLFKYAIGATAMFPNGLYWWHPTQSGAGTRLYPLWIPGLVDLINLLTANGRTNIEVIAFWDQGEANTNMSTYQAALEALDASLQTDVPGYNGKFILRRLHTPYVSSGDLTRLGQDSFAAVDPSKRVSYDSDSFAKWDVGDVHLTIRGQESSGQTAAAAILSKNWID